MANKTTPQKPQTILKAQTKHRNEQKTHGDVRQDRRAPLRARVASPQAARVKNTTRANELVFVSERSQNHSNRRQTVQVTIWVTKPISEQIDEKARLWNVTRSTSGRRLIERGLQDALYATYEATINKVIRDGIAAEMRKQMNWRDTLLIRVLFYIAKTCVIVTNLLCMLLDTEQKTLDAILKKSEEDAKRAIKQFSPYLAGLLTELQQTGNAQEKGN